jgi:hypothetical protein
MAFLLQASNPIFLTEMRYIDSLLLRFNLKRKILSFVSVFAKPKTNLG